MHGGIHIVARISGMLVTLALAAGMAACGGGGSTSSTDVSLTFSEWEIAVDPSQIEAGEARFQLNNEGAVGHNLVIAKSDLPPGELPLDGEAVDVVRLNIVGGTGPIAPGATPAAGEPYTLELSPGKYVLFCDVVANGESHYGNGMFVSLLVEP